MKKLICTMLALVLVMSMAVPAAAVTPTLKIPKVPQISNIKINVQLDDAVYENAVDQWFKAHPIRLDFTRVKLPVRNDYERS